MNKLEYLPLILLFIAIFLCLLPILLRKPKVTSQKTEQKPKSKPIPEYDSEGYNRQGYNEIGKNRQGK